MIRSSLKNKKIAIHIEIAKNALDDYKKIYQRNSYRIDAKKVWLISLQIRTLLTMLILEDYIKEDIFLYDYVYRFGMKSESFKYHIKNSLVPEYTLEQMLLICDIVKFSFTEVRKKVLNDLLSSLGEQKGYHELDNKLYSTN